MVTLDSAGGMLVSMLLKCAGPPAPPPPRPAPPVPTQSSTCTPPPPRPRPPPRPPSRPARYTSATLKNFAAPLGIIMNILLSRYRAKSDQPPPKPKFLLGAALVILALGLFTAAPA